MICKCAVVLTVLELVLGSPQWNQEGERTVGFQPEYDHNIGTQRAAAEHAFLRFKADLEATGKTAPDAEHYMRYFLEKERYSSDPEPDEPEVHEEDPRFSPFESDSSEDLHHTKEEYDEPRFYEHDQYEYAFRTPRSNKDSSNEPSFVSTNAARHRRSVELYEGPPAPLNEDLTVDFTPETKQITEAHFAAIQKEYKRLQATAALAAAYPDRTSPPSKGYTPQTNGQHDFLVPEPHHQGLQLARKKRSYSGQYSPQQSNARHYDDGQYRQHHNKHDDGQYRPHHNKHDDGQYRPQLHNHDAGQYKAHQHQAVQYNTEPFRPAPLNPDGTVAHVPEYHSIAASHLQAHHQALSQAAH